MAVGGDRIISAKQLNRTAARATAGYPRRAICRFRITTDPLAEAGSVRHAPNRSQKRCILGARPV